MDSLNGLSEQYKFRTPERPSLSDSICQPDKKQSIDEAMQSITELSKKLSEKTGLDEEHLLRNGQKPRIQVDIDIEAAIDKLWDLLCSDIHEPLMFRRTYDGALVTLEHLEHTLPDGRILRRQVAREMSVTKLQALCQSRVFFFKEGAKAGTTINVALPRPMASMMLSSPNGRVPLLEQIVRWGVMSDEGHLHLDSGYIPDSRVVVDAIVEHAAVPEVPSETQLTCARELLTDQVRLAAGTGSQTPLVFLLSTLMAPVLRPCSKGSIPIFVIKGGTDELHRIRNLLDTMFALPARLTSNNKRTLRADLYKTLVSGEPLVIIDNNNLDDILAEHGIYDHVRVSLPKLGDLTIPTRSVIIALSDTISPKLLQARHIVPIEIPEGVVAKSAPPNKNHTRALWWALMVIMRHWLAKGMPLASIDHATPYSHFWSVVGGVFDEAGFATWRDVLDELRLCQLHTGSNDISLLAEAWATSFMGKEVVIDEILELAELLHLFPELDASPSRHGKRVRLGAIIKRAMTSTITAAGGSLQITRKKTVTGKRYQLLTEEGTPLPTMSRVDLAAG